jgi:hypothetical protein
LNITRQRIIKRWGSGKLRYYGIKNKIIKENILYTYAKGLSKIRSILPGKNRDYYRANYAFIYENKYLFDKFHNSIPKNHFLKLDCIVTSDLIYKEDIEKLQKGIRLLLQKYRAGHRFIGLPTSGLEEVCSNIEKMDSTLLRWRDRINCGVFDFQKEKLADIIDYFTLNIRNINSSYLSLEFQIFITEKKRKELDQFLAVDYHNARGYINKALASRKEGGAHNVYAIAHYGDAALKSDKIYEWISCIEWEFYEKLKYYFPFILHRQDIMPPRIEIFYTDIDYYVDNSCFWSSVGIEAYNGQFIDERQKMFFETSLSGRYADDETSSRLVYIIKDDGIMAGHMKSVKDKVHYHIEDYARGYFRFLFLKILARTAGKEIVHYKKQLDKIKLKKNKLNTLLKLRYEFERKIDSYVRYTRDSAWTDSINILQHDIYGANDNLLKKSKRHYCITYKSFSSSAMAGTEKIDDAISVLRLDFSDKGKILQHLADYKNNEMNWWLNVATFLIAAVTLFFVVFPEKKDLFAIFLKNICNVVIGFF